MTISSDLFRPTTRLELFKRIRRHACGYLNERIGQRADKAEIASLRADLAAFDDIIRLNTINPLDTPLRPGDPLPPHIPGQGGAVAQPLVPEGSEKEMSGFIDLLLEETRK